MATQWLESYRYEANIAKKKNNNKISKGYQKDQNIKQDKANKRYEDVLADLV